MKRLLPILLLALAGFSNQKLQAQVANVPYYTNLHFNSAFSIVAENDEKSNFYAVNLQEFNSDMEKAYFESLAFQEKKIIRIDAGNANVAWFRSKKVYTEAEIVQLLLSLKTQTINQVGSMTELQKQEWLLRNTK